MRGVLLETMWAVSRWTERSLCIHPLARHLLGRTFGAALLQHGYQHAAVHDASQSQMHTARARAAAAVILLW